MDTKSKTTLKIIALVVIVYLTMIFTFRLLAPAIQGASTATRAVMNTAELTTCVPSFMIMIGLLSAKTEAISTKRMMLLGFVISLLVSGIMAIALPA